MYNAISEAYNMDCKEYMKTIPDKFFHLVVSDPPYGLGFSDYQLRGKVSLKTRHRYTPNGEKKKWDYGVPDAETFEEIFRISKHQIIFGGNYFEYLTGEKESPNLKKKESFLEYMDNSLFNWFFWWKKNPLPNYADGELAWISFPENEIFDFQYFGNINSEYDRIHPTQKPRELYHHIYTKYLLNQKWEDGAKLKTYDSHLGSGSSRIAANILDIDFYSTEKDTDIFNNQEKRFAQRREKLGMFK